MMRRRNPGVPASGRAVTRDTSRFRNRRGMALIGTYVLLSAFLIYTNALAVRTIRERAVVETLHDRLLAMDLARGAAEQLREDLYYFATTQVPAILAPGTGNLLPVLEWMDALGDQAEMPLFDLPTVGVNDQGNLVLIDGDEQRDGTAQNPVCPALPALPSDWRCLNSLQPVEAPRAWIVSIERTGEFHDPREVTIQAEARVNNVTKRVRIVFRLELGMSDIFRYAYFLNNYGWFAATSSSWVEIFGEARSNGDLLVEQQLAATAPNGRVWHTGDLYASKNPEIGAAGTITGDPTDYKGVDDYRLYRAPRARPTRRLTFAGQPPIGGQPKILPYGFGWNTEGKGFPDQRRFAGQDPQPMPYLGNLDIYRKLAKSTKSSVTVNGKKLSESYDDSEPLVLIGTASQPIRLDGPFVASGDVIIKGYVTGRGTIYAGRNVHIIGELRYVNPTVWPALERHTGTGRIREAGVTSGVKSNLGTVCKSGAYIAPGGAVPKGCP